MTVAAKSSAVGKTVIGAKSVKPSPLRAALARMAPSEVALRTALLEPREKGA
jgi:hypothetical protein